MNYVYAHDGWHEARSKEETLDLLFPKDEYPLTTQDLRRGIYPSVRAPYESCVHDEYRPHWYAYLALPRDALDKLTFTGRVDLNAIKRVLQGKVLWVAHDTQESLFLPKSLIPTVTFGVFNGPFLGGNHPIYQNEGLQQEWRAADGTSRASGDYMFRRYLGRNPTP